MYIMANNQVAGAVGADGPMINTIRNRFSQTYNGTINVPTMYANIDVLTNDEIIVIKPMSDWSAGIGLLYIFHSIFPNRSKHLHLYDTVNNQQLLSKLITLTSNLAITITVQQ
jgi:hypothetical protein